MRSKPCSPSRCLSQEREERGCDCSISSIMAGWSRGSSARLGHGEIKSNNTVFSGLNGGIGQLTPKGLHDEISSGVNETRTEGARKQKSERDEKDILAKTATGT